MRRRSVLLVLVITAILIASQVVSWYRHARHRLVIELPAMIRYTFIDAERRMHPYTTWPGSVNLVLARSIDSGLMAHPERFQNALNPARVRVQTEGQALQTGALANARCRDCIVVHYRELTNNPLYARVEVSFTGGDHATSYEQTWVHVLGQWLHFRTRFAWIT